jgi:biotin-dependent carboxylase-like uncharacterized protein
VTLHVLEASGLVTVQDRGRIGWAHLGVPRAGALDPEAAALANRVVGNPPEAAVLELTMARIAFRLESARWLAVTGAPCGLTIGGVARASGPAEYAPPGSTVVVEQPTAGVRSYLAIAGGIDVPPVLGSRSTDTLAWVGPPPVASGVVLPLGTAVGDPQPLDTPRPPAPGPVRVWPGPRLDWFAGDGLQRLCGAVYTVSGDSNRIGVRLAGPVLERTRAGELPSEGIVLGSIQVPPDGQPVVLMHDHPVTGGYPVIGVVDAADLGLLAQARPGETVRFTRAR